MEDHDVQQPECRGPDEVSSVFEAAAGDGNKHLRYDDPGRVGRGGGEDTEVPQTPSWGEERPNDFELKQPKAFYRGIHARRRRGRERGQRDGDGFVWRRGRLGGWS